MKTLFTILAVQFLAFVALADTMPFNPEVIEMNWARGVEVELSFDRIENQTYGPVIVIDYYNNQVGEWRVDFIPVNLPGHTIVREEDQLFLASNHMRSLLAVKKGRIFKRWELVDGFEFSADIVADGFGVTIRPSLTHHH